MQTASDIIHIWDDVLKVWAIFLQCLSIEKVGELLNQITAVLLDCGKLNSDQEPILYDQQVIALLESTIVPNIVQLSPFLNSIFFIPRTPSFNTIHHAITSSDIPNFDALDIFEKIKICLTATSHENMRVVDYGLTVLRNQVEINQGFIHTQAESGKAFTEGNIGGTVNIELI